MIVYNGYPVEFADIKQAPGSDDPLRVVPLAKAKRCAQFLANAIQPFAGGNSAPPGKGDPHAAVIFPLRYPVPM